jgi:hypothetical protein
VIVAFSFLWGGGVGLILFCSYRRSRHITKTSSVKDLEVFAFLFHCVVHFC